MIVWKKYWNLWRIKREWKELETKRGTGVFQQFEFVESLWKHWWEYFPISKSVPVFYVFYENGRAVCIIPVERKINTGERCLFAGANGYDYHDFLYENCEYLCECLRIFTNEVGDLVVSNLRTKSTSGLILNLNGGRGYTCSVEIDVSKHKKLSNGYEEWLKSLSVNVRQNLRTAYNRIRTDGLRWDLLLYRGGDKCVQINNIVGGGNAAALNVKKMFDELIDVYCDRHQSRYKVKTNCIKRWLLKNMDYSTKNYIKWNVGLTIVLRINGRIASFCSGYINDNEYIVPRLSFSEKMKRYSPGMLLVNEVMKYIFTNKQIDVFDLSLGDEDYKLKMGGSKVKLKSGVLKSGVLDFKIA